MASSGAEGEQAVVTAHDWVLGVAFSVLASVIGGASKLSIRKSWIIDARRKQGGSRRVRGPYEEVSRRRLDSDDGGRGFENEAGAAVAPLELGAPPLSPPRGSLSPRDDDDSDGGGSDHYTSLEHRSVRTFDLSDLAHKFLSPGQLSWALYLSGMVGMSFLNPLCCILAMRYANPSILAPFSGLTLVWVVLFSAVTLDEHPGRSQKVACFLIVLGEVLVAAFGDHTNGEEKTVDDVLSSYEEPAFRAFMVFMTLFLVQLGIFIWVCPKTSLLRKMAWGSMGGSITGFQNFLKDTLTIYHAATRESQDSSSYLDDAAATSLPPELFVFIALGSLTAFAGLLFLAACMKRYDATYSAAMFVVSFVLSASLMSAVHYRTLDHLGGPWNYVLYPTGLATLFLGAYLLARPTAFAGTWCGEGAADGRAGDGPPRSDEVRSGAII